VNTGADGVGAAGDTGNPVWDAGQTIKRLEELLPGEWVTRADGWVRGTVAVEGVPFKYVVLVVPRPYSHAPTRAELRRLLILSATPFRIVGSSGTCTALLSSIDEDAHIVGRLRGALGLLPVDGPKTGQEFIENADGRP
jgi:hypothetical protein